MLDLRVNDVVMVHGRSLQPWRARVQRIGGWVGAEWSSRHVEVQPVERGKGWSTTPLVVRAEICTRVDDTQPKGVLKLYRIEGAA